MAKVARLAEFQTPFRTLSRIYGYFSLFCTFFHSRSKLEIFENPLFASFEQNFILSGKKFATSLELLFTSLAVYLSKKHQQTTFLQQKKKVLKKDFKPEVGMPKDFY